ncbi:amidohydrolase [Mesorhizobium sp. M1328]|uniref:amidohydrolase family protein n=1 Tax=Mesorhizobium sp. M1328 TaxID=2957082 RepID=UPI0033383362
MSWIRDIVAETVLADTHEHLVEESVRTSWVQGRRLPCDDWSLLFKTYVQDDLRCAGMGAAEEQRFYDPQVSPVEKFNLLLPFWERVQHTAYAQAVAYTIRELYDIDSFSLKNVEELAEKYRQTRKPGFYQHIIQGVCRISECQVNSVEKIYMETAQPSLLKQDLSIMELSRCSQADIKRVEAETGSKIDSFNDWLAAIDGYFERHGKGAIAVKYAGAYYRRLKFEHVERHMAEKYFATLTAERPFIGPEGSQALEDYLFHYCLARAEEYKLPVKLHTGYLARRDFMQLSNVKANAADVCHLLQRYPGMRFILMHIGYPYQHEYISLAKQYKNVYVDLCWAWILNPFACTQFLTEFVVTAPTHKPLTFGGDYIIAENIVGHSVIARRGISEGLAALFERNWIGRDSVTELAARLMHANAQELFRK